MDKDSINQLQRIASIADRTLAPYVKEALKQLEEYQMPQESVIPRGLLDLVKAQQQHLERLKPVLQSAERTRSIVESSKRWIRALQIVQKELPERGWYLTGQEPAHVTPQIAKLVDERKYVEIDELLIKHAASLNLDVDKCIEWLEQRGVPEYCQNRFRIVMDARTSKDHEIATLVGVPVIDELSRSLYDGRDFTTKRGKMPKPQLACSKAGSDEKLNRFCEGFVDKFGLIQQQVDVSRLEDEDYFNRHAILHGMMRRAYGSKDTAKVFMVLLFLIFAYKEGSGED